MAFFTAHERGELKGIWGSRTTRLGRESFLPFGFCQLCLLPARDPVSCPSHGHLFCRECAISNLFAQNKELKRLKKEAERRRLDDAEDKQLEDAERQARDLDDFERVQAGLRSKGAGLGPAGGSSSPAGLKRKLDGTTDNTQPGPTEKRSKHTDSNGSNAESSFWIPSKIPDNKKADFKAIKQHPVCPAAAANQPHDFTLKGLISVKFQEEKATDSTSTTSEAPNRSCPSCNKTLSNATKAILAKPCGHVLCKPCSDKFQQPPPLSAHVKENDLTVRCYICSEDVTPGRKKKVKRKQDGEKEVTIYLGLVEISSEGTGFAGASQNMVKKEGVAFQC